MGTFERIGLSIANVLLHLAHSALIAFTLTGWLLCESRAGHRVPLLLILASWYALAPLLGRKDLIGYCPLTDLHWRVRSRLGVGRPDGGYIWYLATRITGREIDRAQMDSTVNVIFLACLAVSVAASLLRGRCA